MPETTQARRGELADRPAEVTVSEPVLLAKAYRDYERYDVAIGDAGDAPHSRDVLRAGRVVAILPVDLGRGEVVLLRQFRLAAHLMNGAGDLIEIVAGRVEPDEQPAAAAVREFKEELGVPADRLVELFHYFPAPGIADEYVHFYLGSVDAAQVPPRTGLAAEREEIETLRVTVDEAVSVIGQDRVRNGLTLVALQWLALNRHRLGDILRTGTAR